MSIIKFKLIGLIIITISILFTPIILGMTTNDEILLPPPQSVNMILEESIFRRMSIREFTEEPITNSDLSTILWSAYGYRDDGSRTIPKIKNEYSAVIYVLKEDAAYTYDPWNHSLKHYKEGDWRDIVGWQYSAPIQLGLCWDTKKADKNYAAIELGEIGQNIQFITNALDIGTVVTSQGPNSAIEPLGIPENQEGMIVMPIGHLKHIYDFLYKPRWLSFLPQMQYSDMSISAAIKERNNTNYWFGELTKQQESQLIWASYGYSYLLDISNNSIGRIDRHRTVPSAHGYYPLDMYVIDKNGIYRYYPNFYNPIYGLLHGAWNLPLISFLLKIKDGDFRNEIASASSNPSINTSPYIIISVLDDRKANRWDDLSGEFYRHIWYYEAGASAQNILLEATAQNLKGNIIYPTDTNTIIHLLKLKRNCYPLLIIPISK